jgi:flagellar protein FlaI
MLKGLLYRKFFGKKEGKIEELPGFSIRIDQKIVELPELKDLKKINVTYPLLEPFAYANIKWDEKEKSLIYYVIEPELSEEEKNVLQRISEGLIDLLEIGLEKITETQAAIEYLQTNVLKLLKEFGIKLTKVQFLKLMYYIYRDFIGYNEIEPLMQDVFIEDISCDGVGLPIYIVHRKYGSLKTNVVIKDPERLRDLIIKLAERAGRYVSYAEPILAGTLPDGSRVSATLASDVATHGPTFTIRKFGTKPFSPIEQIEMKTANAEMLAYLWFLVENGASMLIVGGVATGKTSFLNSLAMFIPPEAKIVSIEDTRELRLTHEHWVPGLARVGFGIPLPTGEKYGEVTLFDLLKESFRQNPDYVIVGEVRGKEAYVMFQGMASGHPSLSTFHAGSVETVIHRLTTPPINLSISLLDSLDCIIVMTHAKEKGKSARRVREIVEIIGVDLKTQKVEYNIVYRWNPEKDKFEKVNESIKAEKLALAKGMSKEEALREIERRKKILEWMLKNGIKDYLDVVKIINRYYKEKEELLKEIGEAYIETKVEVQKVEPQKIKKFDKEKILKLLGIKMVKE